MDRLEHVRQLRERYETALDDAERLRAEYHREVVKLHRSGMSLREIAEALGMSHQRVHQIVGGAEERPRRRGRVAGLTAGLVVLALAATAGGLFLARRPESPIAPRTYATNTSSPVAISPHGPVATSPHGCVVRWARGVPTSLLDMATACGRACTQGRETTVVLDPKTGEILAVVSCGSQHSNTTFPGTAFRPFVDAALLDCLIIG